MEKSESPESEERLLFSVGSSISGLESRLYGREEEDRVWRGMLAGLRGLFEKGGMVTVSG
jgi:hypothetical protein